MNYIYKATAVKNLKSLCSKASRAKPLGIRTSYICQFHNGLFFILIKLYLEKSLQLILHLDCCITVSWLTLTLPQGFFHVL